MIKSILFSLAFTAALSTNAQTFTADFEDVTLPATGYYNGSDLAGATLSGGLRLPIEYDAQFSSWYGFGMSSKTDTVDGSYGNQFSCYAGKGADDSEKYAIAYVFNRIFITPAPGSSQPIRLNSFQFTNSTLTGKSIKLGDAFTKKFGGPSGNDPDYFRMKVYNYFGGLITDSATIYLADFRFADNSQDYIVKNWQTANLNFNSPMDSVGFDLESTDNGQFGMNTPAYFCLDNIKYSVFSGINEVESRTSNLAYPNPFQSTITLTNFGRNESIEVLDSRGVLVATTKENSMNLSHLPAGIYLIRQGMKQQRLIKSE